MSSGNPFNAINLHGDGIFRSVTLSLPTERVRNFLPAGLQLGEQNLTPKGTHPVVVSFNELYRAEMSIPSLLPVLTYNEYTFGIPFSHVRRSEDGRHNPGPFYYMPKLYLDSLLAVMGGVLFWGYSKRLARFTKFAEQMTIASDADERMTSLQWSGDGELAPIGEFKNFEPIRRMLDQPLVSAVPASVGPFFVIADFPKRWDVATLRPIRTSMDVHTQFIEGFTDERYPLKGTTAGIDRSVLGSYELHAPWSLGMPYPPIARR